MNRMSDFLREEPQRAAAAWPRTMQAARCPHRLRIGDSWGGVLCR
jgi:hypothetical protein